MDRRRAALVLLLLFILCIGVATVVGVGRPGLQQGIAPAVIEFCGYLFALGAGALLISPRSVAPDGTRAIGLAVLAAVAVLVLLDRLVSDGPNIGAGLVQLVGQVVVLVATLRLAVGIARSGPVR